MIIEITEADRRGAEELFDAALGDMGSYAEYMRPSYREGAVRTISEAFARHRIAALKARDCVTPSDGSPSKEDIVRGGLNARLAREDVGESAEPMAWEPIETAPKDGSYVDLWCAPLTEAGVALLPCRITNCYWVEDYAAWYTSSLRGEPIRVWHRVTHWMTPPNAPGTETPLYTHPTPAELPGDALRATFKLAASQIERDVRLSELTDGEIDALVRAVRG